MILFTSQGLKGSRIEVPVHPRTNPTTASTDQVPLSLPAQLLSVRTCHGSPSVFHCFRLAPVHPTRALLMDLRRIGA